MAMQNSYKETATLVRPNAQWFQFHTTHLHRTSLSALRACREVKADGRDPHDSSHSAGGLDHGEADAQASVGTLLA